MRLQHLALFRGIGLDACAVNLVGECLQRAWRRTGCGVFLPVITQLTVEGAPDFPLRFPNVALRQNRLLRL